MRLMLRMKNKAVTPTIQAKLIASNTGVLKPRMGSTCPDTKPRTMLTTCVRGRTAMAAPCAAEGSLLRGKKVPQRKNIGVRKRKLGKLKKSMLGAAAVKHIAIELNIKPPKNANGIASRNSGLRINPKAATTAKTIVELMVARVAPHRSSPATTSSTLMGVATMASNVFWKYMRTNEAKVHSKKDPFIMAIATNAGAMNAR